MSKKIETINITPAPMSIASAVELYKRMTDEGKAGFVECFNPDDQDACSAEHWTQRVN